LKLSIDFDAKMNLLLGMGRMLLGQWAKKMNRLDGSSSQENGQNPNNENNSKE
jgi:hypothetical protein